ncbi:hypothetical protein BKA67DRAFT_530211 [Truncatella angustata]|uniref:Nucleotide exchange factor SIL1 n=1 Tax=Truncatella angustata TaxID=152316 RepID=A0A9P9A4A6_9PEZI|nr:uncharacterized protein BKA67DRAFT_530211 [Truncatella angustata]KAH6660095.1 hypothetical protein BKA67DRAFT_530211 [Truncatella angustata]KAH8202639.1 hypothetical protein TruAng_003240 [Truncatella angustata]
MWLPAPSRSSLRVTFSLALLLCLASSILAASSDAAPSPSAKSDVICHTDNPADCYPKVFSPTEEFQIVRDDQDLPPGLHVRMDIYSGKKEAKLYTPDADDPALEGLPVERSVVVVDPEVPDDTPQIPAGAPSYDSVGAVKGPQVHNPDFAAALDFLKNNAETAPSPGKHPLDDALVDLEDISHDMYYGKEIMDDEEAVKSLFCLLTQRDAEHSLNRDGADHWDLLASSILSSSLQNNPPALLSLESYWDSLMDSQCKSHSKPLKDVFFNGLEPSTPTSDHDDALEALWIRRALPVVGKLLKSSAIRSEFIHDNGMKHFLQILLTKGDVWEAARMRVSRIVSDTFLDETVGAKKGMWPVKPAIDPSNCKKDGSKFDEGCWEYHLGQIIQETNAEWAHDLLAMIDAARLETGHVKDEL